MVSSLSLLLHCKKLTPKIQRCCGAIITRSVSYHNNEKNKRFIDFRSDTVTSPSQAMLETALQAQTGDDVLGEDPTVIELQNYVADFFGKEKGLFVPTGTMSNLCAIMAHCHSRASEIILGSQSHICLWEGGNTAGLANVHSRQLMEDNETGELNPQQVYDSFRTDDDDRYAKTELLCLENTYNALGGIPLSPDYVNSMGDMAHKLGIRLHVDGARICNAAIAQQISMKAYCANVDSVSVCLSKGLGAPLGSVLIGDTEFIRLAKRARKRCGGGMRQAGIVAAMGLYAIQNNYHLLVDDHIRAKRLAHELQEHGFRLVRNGQVDTNMFYFQLPKSVSITQEQFTKHLVTEYGIKISSGYGVGGETFRVVVHLDIHDEDITKAAEAMVKVAFNE